jgi:hypothetical protein
VGLGEFPSFYLLLVYVVYQEALKL